MSRMSAKALVCKICERCAEFGLSKALFYVEVDGCEYSVEVQLTRTEPSDEIKPTKGFKCDGST